MKDKFTILPIFSGAILILLGLFLISFPNLSRNIILTSIACVFIVKGIISFLTYLSSRNFFHISRSMLIQTLIDVTFGVILLINIKFFSLAISILIGVWALANGLLSVILTFKSKSLSNQIHIREYISCAVQVVFGILCIVSPVWGSLAVITFSGLLMIVSGIATIILAKLLKK